MSSPMDAISASSHPAGAATASQAASPSRAEQLAALNQLHYKYQVGISRHESAGALGSLTRQVTAAEQTRGHYLSLAKARSRTADSAGAGGQASAGGSAATQHRLIATA